MLRRVTLCLAVAAVAWTAEVNAQEEVEATEIPLTEEAEPTPLALDRRLGDRIMAVVGDDLLLESEWVEQTLILAEQLGVARGTPQFELIATEAFDQIIRNLIIVSVARRDTMIMIDEDLVLEQVDREIEQISERFPSEADFRRELERSQWGSLAAYRADIQDRKRREMLGEALLEIRRDEIKAPTISDGRQPCRFWYSAGDDPVRGDHGHAKAVGERTRNGPERRRGCHGAVGSWARFYERRPPVFG